MARGVIRGLEPPLLQNQFWSKTRFYTHGLSLEVKQSSIIFEESHVAIRLIFWIIGSISKSELKKEVEILVLLIYNFFGITHEALVEFPPAPSNLTDKLQTTKNDSDGILFKIVHLI